MSGGNDHGLSDNSSSSSQYVETDPTGRYGRYAEILGKGSSKIVYRAFDEYEGIEVAWNQVKLTDFLQRPEDLERLYSEIHLLKTLKHKSIMKFYASWVDTTKRNINFVTEMFTSGTLRQYRLKHRKVNIRAVKHWCRQVLEGLLYLHSHDPPVIHRDLKCDNIFINGNQGEVKIGDLGLAAILRKSHAARCVGTPEFMAPEVYAEEYNELVDIYSFGMCVLEMVTFEYPYSECTHPAQIYKKVTSGRKPNALYKVKDPEVRAFVEKCLATVANRLSARELLEDPFLCDYDRFELRSTNYEKGYDQMGSEQLQRQNESSVSSHEYAGYEPDHDNEYQTLDLAASEIELFNSPEDNNMPHTDISIMGKRKANGDIFLRLKITDKEGRVRNIYFPFDTETDTALTVATEMVGELDINDHDVTRIADMIDGEIAGLVPEWKSGLSFEEPNETSSLSIGKDYVPNGTLADYLSLDNPGFRDLQILRSPSFASIRGRFEEITYQDEASEIDAQESGVVAQGDDLWAHHDRRPSWGFHGFNEICELQDQSICENDKKMKNDSIQRRKVDGKDPSTPCNSPRTPYHSPAGSIVDDLEFENEKRKELKWLKAKHQLNLQNFRHEQLGTRSKPPLFGARDHNLPKIHKKISLSSNRSGLDDSYLKNAFQKHFSSHIPADFGRRKIPGSRHKLRSESSSPEHIANARSLYSGSLVIPSLKRTTSLPLDAVDY